jgi:hypothetical protein
MRAEASAIEVILNIVREQLAFWKDWPMDMIATSLLPDRRHGQAFVVGVAGFSLNGTCPHCLLAASCVSIGTPHFETVYNPQNLSIPTHHRSWAVLQCQGCKKYILGAVERDVNGNTCKYLEHFPLGRPNDDVPQEVPTNVATDFKEALRCRWVDAYNATAEMCRRAIQSGCLELGAPPSDSITSQIDWIHQQGKINQSLKDVAHKIRLGGNRAAHPSDQEEPISSEEADAIVEFTQFFLENVYVIPKQMAKYDFSKSGRKAQSESVP